MTSITKIAISETEPPLLRNDTNEWWPGVSMKSSPGDLNLFPRIIFEQVSLRISAGTSVAPIC